MSETINLESLRKEAKALLKRCRAGDAEATERIRRQLGRLAGVDTHQLSESIKLADIQHALAREHGYHKWADLKRHDEPVGRLLAAVRGGALQTARLELTAHPDLPEESIHAACAVGDVDAVRHHLERDGELLESAFAGWPPLAYACGSPFHRLSLRHAFSIQECVAALLDRGADPNASTAGDLSDPKGKTSRILSVFSTAILTRALMANNRLAMQLLAQRGAVPDREVPELVKAARARLHTPDDPLNMAFTELMNDPAFRDEFNRRTVKFLERAKLQRPLPADPPQFEQSGPVAFSRLFAHMSARDLLQLDRPDVGATRDRNLAVWELAFEHGLDPNLPCNANGETLLHRYAPVDGEVSAALVELFLKHGANSNAKTVDGIAPYAVAVRAGNRTVADLLLAHGASPDSVNAGDELLGACRRGDVERAWSIHRSNPGTIQSVQADAVEVLAVAAKANNVAVVRLMGELGFNLAADGADGATALHLASWFGHPEIVRLLLEFRVPVNQRDVFFGTSPLGWAAHGSARWSGMAAATTEDYCDIVRVLRAAGATYEAAVNRWGVGPDKVAAVSVALMLMP